MNKIIMPEIGESISPRRAINFCKYFGLDSLVARLTFSLDNYITFEFDGCSMIPDKFITRILNKIPGLKGLGKKVTYDCCFKHDLKYAFGDPSNLLEKLRADLELYEDLKTLGLPEKICVGTLVGVLIGGSDKFDTSFKWGFARKV